MKIRYAPLVLAAALMLAAAAPARAIPVTYYFGGTLDFASGLPLPSLPIGSPFTGSFTFESTAVDVDPLPYSGIYPAVLAFDVNVNGLSYSRGGSAAPQLFKSGVEVWDSDQDYFIVQEYDVVGPTVDGFAPVELGVHLFDYSGTTFSSDALPSALPLSSFTYVSVFIFANSNGGYQSGNLMYLTAASTPPVPEASTSAVLVLGLAALAFVRRRKTS